MNTQSIYKFSLDTSGKKITCESCGQRRSVRYKNNETGDFFPDIVSRCDRENSCGYHYTPKQYLIDIGSGFVPSMKKKDEHFIEPIIDYMPLDYVQKSMHNYQETNFANFMIDLFGKEIATKALLKYFVGLSHKKFDGKASIFWQIDIEEKVRTGKIMGYDPGTGKRVKAPANQIDWVHTYLKPFNFRQCFFGEHLLSEFQDKTIAITESEKTAIICSVLMPEMIWLATGGKNGCKWREFAVYKVLKDRNIILFPDHGFYNKERTCFQKWNERAEHISEKIKCTIKVSSILEDTISKESLNEGFDLVDFLIKRDKDTGIALTDFDYPLIWDFKGSNPHLSQLSL